MPPSVYLVRLVRLALQLVLLSVPVAAAAGPTLVRRRDLPVSLWVGAPLAAWLLLALAGSSETGAGVAARLWTGFALGWGLAVWVRPDEPVERRRAWGAWALFVATSLGVAAANVWAFDVLAAPLLWLGTVPVPLLAARRGPRNERVLLAVAGLAALAAVASLGIALERRYTPLHTLAPDVAAALHALACLGLAARGRDRATWGALGSGLVAVVSLCWPGELLRQLEQVREIEERRAFADLPRLTRYDGTRGSSRALLVESVCPLLPGEPLLPGCLSAARIVGPEAPWPSVASETVLVSVDETAWPPAERYAVFRLYPSNHPSPFRVPLDAPVGPLPSAPRGEVIVPDALPWTVQDVVHLCVELSERGASCRREP